MVRVLKPAGDEKGDGSMNKKFLAVLLVAVMLCVTGCNQEKQKEVSLPYDHLKSEVLDPVELQIYTQGTIPSYGGDAIKGMLSQISADTRETINISPVFNWVAYELYDTKIPQLIASGEKIDAFTCFSPKPFIEQKLCIDLTTLFKQYAPTYYYELMNNEMGKDYLTSCTADGKLYAIPYNSINNPRICVVAKADLAAKYAQDGLETLEDYGEFLKKVKENEAGVTPGLVNAFEYFQAYMEGNGYYETAASFLYSKWEQNGEGLYAIEQAPEFLDAFELLRTWKDKGYVLKNNKDENQYPITSKFLASVLLPMNYLSDRFTYAQQENNLQLKVIPLYMQSLHVINSFAQGLAVTENCRNPERVMMFLEWLHGSQENYDLFMYGKEGVNYSLQNGNLVISQDEFSPLYLWKYYGAGFFQDYRYERLVTNLDSNFRQLYLDSSFMNVQTNAELREQIQKRREVNEVDMDKLEKDNPQVSAIMDTYYDNLDRFTQTIDSGVFRMTIDELKEMQKEAGIEKALEFYRKALGY